MNDLSTPFSLKRASNFTAPSERLVYPFKAMKVGDALVFWDAKKAESARVAAYQFSRKDPSKERKFSLRKTSEGWCLIRLR